MRMLAALSPFLIFVMLDRMVGVKTGLFTAMGTSAALLLVDALLRRKRAKLLELGTLVLFGALAAYVTLSGTQWSVAGIRLAVDTGLLLIVLGSMVVGQPFTIQYAREGSPSCRWNEPAFVRTNYVISAAWAAAFALMVAVDAAWVMMPELSPTIVLVVSGAAVYGAFRFSRWYVGQMGTTTSRKTT